MGDMDELTVREIAEKTGLSFETVKSRIRILKIKAIRKVGRTNIYARKIVEEIMKMKPVGRPPKKPEDPAKAKPAKK
jgi:predicted nucleotidyltransferase